MQRFQVALCLLVVAVLYFQPAEAQCDNNQQCFNGGTCVAEPNGPGYECHCLLNFYGQRCQFGCDGACANGDCKFILNTHSFTCECHAGWTNAGGDKTQPCDVQINECLSYPCQNGGVCEDEINGYSCHCVAGFTGTHCETNIDDCDPSPCQNRGICVDGIQSYTCDCPDGFTGDLCQYRTDRAYCLKCSGVETLEECHVEECPNNSLCWTRDNNKFERGCSNGCGANKVCCETNLCNA